MGQVSNHDNQRQRRRSPPFRIPPPPTMTTLTGTAATAMTVTMNTKRWTVLPLALRILLVVFTTTATTIHITYGDAWSTESLANGSRFYSQNRLSRGSPQPRPFDCSAVLPVIATRTTRRRLVDQPERAHDDGIIDATVVVEVTESSSSSSSNGDDATNAERTTDAPLDREERKLAVGNLVADDEWLGLSMELSDVVRKAVVEDLKKNAREFLGEDEYVIGAFTKEIDKRVKQEVANYRGKDEYELFDLVLALDETSKSLTEQLTGKPYQVGDLSVEIDKRVKQAVVNWAGKPGTDYVVGDLSREMARRIEARVNNLTGQESYEFGDISRAIEESRRKWVTDFLGEDAAENYQFGDLTKKAISQFTGNDSYKPGDISKKLFGNLFAARKKETGDKGAKQ